MNTYYLYLIGQANSLVINQMLKFALYMYILDNTGSSVIYSNNKTNNLVIGIGGCVMITGIILWMCQTRNVIFITILVLCSIIQFNINIFSIVCLSDIMRKTKEEYMGRIMGFVSMITNMFQPISQIIYGRGLEYTISGFGKFLIMIAVSILGISLYRKNVIKREKK